MNGCSMGLGMMPIIQIVAVSGQCRRGLLSTYWGRMIGCMVSIEWFFHRRGRLFAAFTTVRLVFVVIIIMLLLFKVERSTTTRNEIIARRSIALLQQSLGGVQYFQHRRDTISAQFTTTTTVCVLTRGGLSFLLGAWIRIRES